MKQSKFATVVAPLLFFTVLSFLVMGYHPGYEDDGVYLSAIKADLNPALYPHDADFFRLQMQASVFDKAVAGAVRLTRIDLAWIEFFIQILSLAFILWAARGIARKLFVQIAAQWAAVAMLAAMFTLPVAGTALFICDQHLHPRNLATAFTVIAIWRLVENRTGQAVPCLVLSFVLHPIMGAMGISFAFFTWLIYTGSGAKTLGKWSTPSLAAVAAIPVFGPPNPEWRQAVESKSYLFLGRWEWCEWLGALAPLALFWVLARLAGRRGERNLARFAWTVFVFGVFQQTIAFAMLSPGAPIRLAPLQPMRYLQLVYLFLVMIAGGLIGRFLLRRAIWRWAVFLVLVNGGMFAAQRALLPSSPHLELPGVAAGNDWLQAFAWIRQNTPANAYFALDPHYLEAPGDDEHSFRALAERSVLADAVKDASVVTQTPELGPIWAWQVTATEGWRNFKLADFERLKAEFGVDWALVSYPATEGLHCVWHDRTLAVCRVP
ncbi:MAG: DUF6798 domain-containing protein [Terracidiphilus sp.]